MNGARLISGLAGARAVASPPRRGATGKIGRRPRRSVASWWPRCLAEPNSLAWSEVAALRPPTRVLLAGFVRVDCPGRVGHRGSRDIGRDVCGQLA